MSNNQIEPICPNCAHQFPVGLPSPTKGYEGENANPSPKAVPLASNISYGDVLRLTTENTNPTPIFDAIRAKEQVKRESPDLVELNGELRASNSLLRMSIDQKNVELNKAADKNAMLMRANQVLVSNYQGASLQCDHLNKKLSISDDENAALRETINHGLSREHDRVSKLLEDLRSHNDNLRADNAELCKANSNISAENKRLGETLFDTMERLESTLLSLEKTQIERRVAVDFAIQLARRVDSLSS